jgi:cytochrome b
MTTVSITGRQHARSKVPVWDLFVRLFHWLLVATIATAAVTGFFADASWIDVHVWTGVLAAGLVILRIIWGVLGTTHARFTDFVAGPKKTLEHLRRLRAGRTERHRGHNPLGGVMVLLLLVMIIALAATGVIALAGTLKVGPLAFATSFTTGRLAREVHEILAFFLTGLVALHLAGALFESRRTQENLVRAMIDGKKELRETDLLSTERRACPRLAMLIAVALLIASAGSVWSLVAKPGLGVPAAPLDPTYVKECAACHIAYHPSLLPRDSWAALMAGLDEHFGENADLDAATGAAIAGYLQEQAAETYDTKPANLFRRVNVEKSFTITATPFWLRTHAGIPDRVFSKQPVGQRGNCEACHSDARAGRFYPGATRIPRETGP